MPSRTAAVSLHWSGTDLLPAIPGCGHLVAGQHLLASQFADDLTVVLPHVSAVPSFLAIMTVFGQASGQAYNPAKTQSMIIEGMLGRGSPSHAALPWSPR